MYDVTVSADLAYADVDSQPLLADLYRPATGQAPPVVLYVHGGGFAVGSRSDGAEGRLAALAAHAVAVLPVDYRLVPAAHFPAQLHDVKAAVRRVRGCPPALVRAGARSPGAHRGLPLRHPERFLTGRQRSEHGRATALRMDCAAACP
jgi:acetyl esterase/lipase